MIIKGKQTYLRAMEPEDMALYREALNDPATELCLLGWSFPISRNAQDEWYAKAAADSSAVRLTIALAENHTAIGMASLARIDWKNRCAQHAIRLFPQAERRRGYGYDAALALQQYAFSTMQLHRLECAIAAYNEASLGLYRKCGFIQEGIRRKALFKQGQYHDVVTMGILAGEANG